MDGRTTRTHAALLHHAARARDGGNRGAGSAIARDHLVVALVDRSGVARLRRGLPAHRLSGRPAMVPRTHEWQPGPGSEPVCRAHHRLPRAVHRRQARLGGVPDRRRPATPEGYRFHPDGAAVLYRRRRPLGAAGTRGHHLCEVARFLQSGRDAISPREPIEDAHNNKLKEETMPELQTQGTFILIGMVLAYLAVTTWLTFRYRARSTSDFMFAARSVPALVIGVLMMSEFIAPKSTIGVAQVAFDSGMAASWAVLSVALGFPLFGWLLAKKLYNTGEYTISAAIAKEYGRSTQLTVSMIMIYALLLVNVAFYVSGAAALSSAFHMSLTTSAVIIAAVSSFYCVIGGQKSAAYVSLLHTTLKCVGISIILCVALSMTGGIAPMMEKMPDYYFTWDGKIGITT